MAPAAPRQLARQVNRRRAVRSADDADGRRLRQGEGNQAEVVQRQRPSTVAKIPNCAAAPSSRVRDSPAAGRVGHRADAHKDDQRRDTGANRHFIEQRQHPARSPCPPPLPIWLCTDGSASATPFNACTSGAQFSFAQITASCPACRDAAGFPARSAPCPLPMLESSPPEANRQQQQRLELLRYRASHKAAAGHQQHDAAPPAPRFINPMPRSRAFRLSISVLRYASVIRVSPTETASLDFTAIPRTVPAPRGAGFRFYFHGFQNQQHITFGHRLAFSGNHLPDMPRQRRAR